MAKKTLYVVARGREPGIYRSWSGEHGAAGQVQGFPGALFKGFARREDALAWLETLDEKELPAHVRVGLIASLGDAEQRDPSAQRKRPPDRDSIIIYTDGGAIGNPGPGGYGAVLRFGRHCKELSGGFRMTTNNRMELMACIAALEALKRPEQRVLPTPIVIYSDSRYVVDGVREGWAERWRRHNWQRSNGDIAENVDLWARLLALCDTYPVSFRWVKGHAGHPDNERADQLASEAALQENLPSDTAFEAGETQTITPRLL